MPMGLGRGEALRRAVPSPTRLVQQGLTALGRGLTKGLRAARNYVNPAAPPPAPRRESPAAKGTVVYRDTEPTPQEYERARRKMAMQLAADGVPAKDAIWKANQMVKDEQAMWAQRRAQGLEKGPT